MRKYETMFILNSGFTKEELPEKVEKFINVISNAGGQVDKITDWGKRRLAYEVKKQRDGYFVLVNFSAEPGVSKELERIFRISEEVVRYLIVRLED